MMQSEIFERSFNNGEKTASCEFNKWLIEHPDYELKDIKYSESGRLHHSILILYETDPKGSKQKRIDDSWNAVQEMIKEIDAKGGPFRYDN